MPPTPKAKPAAHLAAENETLRRELGQLKSRFGPTAPARGPHETGPSWDSHFAELLTDCAYVHIDGHVVAINSAGVKQLGANSAEEIIGRRNFDFIHPKHHAATRERMALIADGRSRASFSRRRRLRLDGNEYPAEVSATRFRFNGADAQLVIVHDITDRVQTNHKLSQARALLADAADNISDGLAIFDQHERFVFANDKFLQNNPSRAEVLKPGITFERFMRHALGRNASVAPDELEEQVARRLKWLRTASGSNEFRDALGRWFLVSHRRTKSGTTVILNTDITARKRAEQDLVEAKEMAEASSRAKSDFLANMSHELRTPLNAVIGFADVIAGEMFGPIGTDRYREYANNIRHAGTHLLEIITDILDLAKVEADRVVLEEEPIDVPDLLAMCATLVAGRATEAEVQVCIRAAPDLPLLVADELRVKQIVLNLLSNAVKFSPNGAEVSVTAGLRADGGIEIVVRDRGCGMTEDGLRLAVQPFRQVSGGIAKRNEGVGLGLPLALRLTKLHGGELVIESTPGQGTTARAGFPATRSAGHRSGA